MSADIPRQIVTPRLLLRRWRDSDREPFAAMNADPQVMEHFPNSLTRAESDARIERIERHFAEHGFGLWAIEVREGAPFAGFIGLAVPTFQADFTPCIEIGWRLAAAHWGQGYATEGAKAALAFGFETLGLDEIVSFTVPENVRSRRVMEKIGMWHDAAGDFAHPLLPPDHRLSRHVLYRIRRPDADASILRDPQR